MFNSNLEDSNSKNVYSKTLSLVRGQENLHECEHMVVHMFGINSSSPSPTGERDKQCAGLSHAASSTGRQLRRSPSPPESAGTSLQSAAPAVLATY